MSLKKAIDLEVLAQDPETLATLVQEHQMYKEALDALPEIVVIHDEHKNVIGHNQYYKVLLQVLLFVGYAVNDQLENRCSQSPAIAYELISCLAIL